MLICNTCHYPVDPGQEISLDASDKWLHCPYCAGKLFGKSTQSDDRLEEYRRERNIRCFMDRRKVREGLVQRLRQEPRGMRCSMCHHPISEDDLLLLRHAETYRCQRCGFDPAHAEYQKEAFTEQRWLSIVPLFQETMAECGDCCYLGAIARACLDAFSRMSSDSEQADPLKQFLAREDWRTPETDCQMSCAAVQQYMSQPGEGMLLLSILPR